MNNNFLAKYEQDLIDKTTKKVKEEVKEEITINVSKNIAKKLKNELSDIEIAKYTGLTLKEVQNLWTGHI